MFEFLCCIIFLSHCDLPLHLMSRSNKFIFYVKFVSLDLGEGICGNIQQALLIVSPVVEQFLFLKEMFCSRSAFSQINHIFLDLISYSVHMLSISNILQHLSCFISSMYYMILIIVLDSNLCFFNTFYHFYSILHKGSDEVLPSHCVFSSDPPM